MGKPIKLPPGVDVYIGGLTFYGDRGDIVPAELSDLIGSLPQTPAPAPTPVAGPGPITPLAPKLTPTAKE